MQSLVVARSLILFHTSSSGSDDQVVTWADTVAVLEILVINMLNPLSIITVQYILNAVSKLLGILTYCTAGEHSTNVYSVLSTGTMNRNKV